MAGRQKGAQADQLWRDALRIVAAEEIEVEGKKQKKLRRVASKLFDAAMDGDTAAAREIGDRLDGRPRQVVAGDPENPLAVVTKIERKLVKPDN